MNHIIYYKENFDETKARFQQWWKGNSLGRPMLALSARRERPLPVDPPEPFADLTDKYTHVERQISHFRFNAAHRSYLGESFPALNVVWRLPLLAEYFGARPEYLPNTVWYERCVFDYNRDLPSLRLKPDPPLFLHHQQMLRKAVSLAEGNFFITIPDLMERLDVLSALRGAQDLCLDFFDCPELLLARLRELDDTYRMVYDTMYDIVKDPQDGGSVWIAFQVWEPGRMAKLQCDFSTLLSPDLFDEFMLPGLRRQCDEIEYCFYHLDGKAAIVHLNSILSLDKLKCLQWTPGDGQPDGGNECWLPLYEKVRAAGKGLWISLKDGTFRDAVRAADQLVRRLGPEGLYLHFLYDLTEAEGRELINYAERHWHC